MLFGMILGHFFHRNISVFLCKYVNTQNVFLSSLLVILHILCFKKQDAKFALSCMVKDFK